MLLRGEGIVDAVPQRANRYPKDRLSPAEHLRHLLAFDAFLDLLPIAEYRHMLETVRRLAHQVFDRVRHVLQVHTDVEQFLRHGQNDHIAEGIQPTRPRTARWRDGWHDDAFARPIIKLPVRDAGHTRGDGATVPTQRLMQVTQGKQLPLHHHIIGIDQWHIHILR